jgi:tripartite-type tricarboxylate transporter receptor subunit TctC
MNDVIANHVDLYLGSVPQLMPQVRAGKLRALGVTSPQRARQAPEVPTLSEAVPGYALELWWGVFAPGNMPRELVVRLNAEINKALQAPAIRQYMENEAAVPGNASAEQFGALVESELVNWQAIAKQANIRLD